MGGALGLAVLASLAASRTSHMLSNHSDRLTALNSGYHVSFIVGATFAALAAIIGYVVLRPSPADQSYQSH